MLGKEEFYMGLLLYMQDNPELSFTQDSMANALGAALRAGAEHDPDQKVRGLTLAGDLVSLAAEVTAFGMSSRLLHFDMDTGLTTTVSVKPATRARISAQLGRASWLEVMGAALRTHLSS